MKLFSKYFLVILLGSIILCFCSTSLAQTSNLWSIEMSFCNNNQKTNEVDLTARIGKEVPVCVQFTNVTSWETTFNIELVDAVVTDDKGLRACNAPDRPKMQFANFAKKYDHTITLQSWETIKKNYIIQYPMGFKWLSHWCIMYNVVGDKEQNNNGFLNVIIRSAKFIDVFVSGANPTQMIDIFQNPKIKKIGNEYSITLWIANNGNVDEKIHIQSLLSNFARLKDFSFDTTIPADARIIFTTPTFILPIYGWPFWFTSETSYTPEFNFNIIDGKHPSEIYIGGTKKIQTILFVWTRQSGVIIGIILLLVYWMIRRGTIAKKINKNK